MQEGNISHFLSILAYAADQHKSQRRKNPEAEPYINHPIQVAQALAVAGVRDMDILSAALLHDVVEDTGASYEDLARKGGASPEAIEYVRQVSDDKSLPKVTRKRLQIEHAGQASYGARLIKLADKLDNLRSFFRAPPVGWAEKEILGYFAWSRLVIAAAFPGGSKAQKANSPENRLLCELETCIMLMHIPEDYDIECYYTHIQDKE